MLFMYAFKGICAPASHLRLKSLRNSLPNVYLASFLGSVDSFIRSTNTQLVVSYKLMKGRFLRYVLTIRDIYAQLNAAFKRKTLKV